MSNDLHEHSFVLTDETPARGSNTVHDSSNRKTPSPQSSRGARVRGGRSAKHRKSNASTPATSNSAESVADTEPPMTPLDEIGEELSEKPLATLVIPLLDPTDEHNHSIQMKLDLTHGGLVHSTHCEEDELMKANRAEHSALQETLFPELHTYQEVYEPIELPPVEPPVENYKTYYRSAVGLSNRREIAPLFTDPITLVANHFEFELIGETVVGKRQIESVAMPWTPLDGNPRGSIKGETTLVHFTRLDKPNPHRKRYFNNLRMLKFMLATWDALMYSYQLIREASVRDNKRGLNIPWTMNSSLYRQIRTLRKKLLINPYKVAKELKEVGGHARSWFFGGPKPKHGLLRDIRVKYYCLLFSYIGRALPPPCRREIDEGYNQLVQRLTSVPPPELPTWRPWVKEYLEKFKPKNPSYPTDSSGGASLGYKRMVGGFSRAVQDLVSLGLCLNTYKPSGEADSYSYTDTGYVISFETIVLGIKMKGKPALKERGWLFEILEGGGVKPRQLELEDLNDLAMLQRLFSLCLRDAVHWTMENLPTEDGVSQIPFVALGAPEPGLKTRYPTIGPAAILLISQLLRRAADSHLVLDRRNSESLGGKKVYRFGDGKIGPWYSQDLTAATDLHPFWLQRTFYEEVLNHHPKLEQYRQYLPVLFGPRRLLSPEAAEKLPDVPDNPFISMIRGHWDQVFGKMDIETLVDSLPVTQHLPRAASTKRKTPADPNMTGEEPISLFTYGNVKAPFVRGDAKVKPGAKLSKAGIQPSGLYSRGDKAAPSRRTIRPKDEFIGNWRSWWETVSQIPYTKTTTGNPMGEAASFPLLPLVTNHSAMRAGISKHITCGDDAKLALNSKRSPTVLKEEQSSRSDRMNEILAQLPALPKMWGPEERLLVLEQSLAEHGAVLSRGNVVEGKPNKIFKHKDFSLFKEIPMHGDRVIPYIPTKLISAPPGGSKGSVTWYTQPTAIRLQAKSGGFGISKKFWRKLPFYNESLAAFMLGLPVREPVMFGGINHPNFPHSAGTNSFTNQKWLSALSGISLVQWATGTGLSPLPKSIQQKGRSAATGWLNRLVSEEISALKNGSKAESRILSRLPHDPLGRGTLPTLKEAADTATQGASSYLLYTTSPVEFLATPSIMAISNKFHRRISKGIIFLKKRKKDGKTTPLNYSDTLGDIDRKRNTYLLNADELIPWKTSPRAFGLYEGVLDPKRKAWRFDWLERGALTNDDFLMAFANDHSDPVIDEGWA